MFMTQINANILLYCSLCVCFRQIALSALKFIELYSHLAFMVLLVRNEFFPVKLSRDNL